MTTVHKLAATLAIILFVTGCGLVDDGGIPESPGANARTATLPEGDSTLLFWTADAAVRGTVLGIGKATEDEYPADGGYPLVTLRVDEVLWLAPANPPFVLPEIAAGSKASIVVRSPATAVDDMEIGGGYVVFLTPGGYFGDDDGNIVVPKHWWMTFATSPDGVPIPTYATEADRAVIAALLEPDEGRSDVVHALIEYAEESNTAVRTWENPVIGPRLGRVRDLYDPGWRENTQPPDPVDTWMSIEPAQRHLPSGPEDVPPGLIDRLGLDLVPYEIVVIDGGVLEDEEAISLFIDEVGVLGAHVVDHLRGATIITGMGPPRGGPWRVSLVGWKTGAALIGEENSQVAPEPTDTILDLTGAFAVDGRESDQEISAGIYLIVDLRATPAGAEALTQDEFQKRLMELQPLLDREPIDPFDPDPGG